MEKYYGNVLNPHSPVWADEAHTRVNLTISIQGRDGEFPFTADPNDLESHGVDLYRDAIAGEFGPIAAWVPPSTEFIASLARSQRDGLLLASDWTQNADIPQATKDKWAPYRQALRDVPQQAGFPNNIVWPTPPQ